MSEDAHADAVTPSLRVVERERTDGARPERAQPQHKALDDTKHLTIQSTCGKLSSLLGASCALKKPTP
jgi:hypothetical protein